MISLKYYDVVKKDVFPLNTSITGKGNKKFLSIIKKHFPKLKFLRSIQASKCLIGKYLQNGILKKHMF